MDFFCSYKKLFFLVVVLFSSSTIFAQSLSITGKVFDKTLNEDMIGANVLLYRLPDTAQVNGTVSDIDGTYRLSNVRQGKYLMKVSFIGYQMEVRNIQVAEENLSQINFELVEDAKVLQEVQVQAVMPRMILKDDTVQMNADAFKVNPDADAADLVTKMPGVIIQDGKVQAQGEDVKRVLVDGKEFFGDDAMMVLKNLPADIVDKVQIFDRLGDQAQFSGFNDGNTEKTINIITRGTIKDGVFGRVYAGYGTEKRYNAGGNINYFKGERRISLLGLSNNINLQNFSTEDLVGVASSTASSGRGGSSGGPLRGGGGGPQGGPGGGNNANNFISNSQGGVNTTNGIGVNYVETFKKGVKLSSSYFYNRSKNLQLSELDRFYSTEGFEQNYLQNQNSESYNNNHRINAKIDYDIDKKKSLTFTPRFSFQNREGSSLTNALTSLLNGETLSNTENKNESKNNGLNFSNSILYKQKLAKEGRSYSVRFESGFNNRLVDNYLFADNYFASDDSLYTQNQWTDGLSKTFNVGGEVNYTDAFGENNQIQLSYAPSYSKSTSDRFTYQYDALTNTYTLIDTTLSNVFDNINTAHRAGVSYRYKFKNFSVNLGANYQYTTLNSDRTFPRDIAVEKDYHNFLPTAQVSYKFSNTSNINLFYRTNVRTPNVSQLQDVVDNTNPLILSSGSKDLDQQYSHNLGLRWRTAQPAKGRSAFIFVGASLNNNYITNATLLATRDTLLANDIVLPAGGQYTRPVNLDGNWSVRSFFNYGTPLLFMKSNLNMLGGVSYNRTPNIVNELVQHNNVYNFNAGMFIGSNISEKVDFRVGYNANYNIVQYSQQRENSNYYTGIVNATINVLPWKGLVLSSDINYNHYVGLTGNYNNNYALWNAAVGYKFLKNRAAELRLNVFDILGVNNSISRTVTETYVEDAQSNVLGRYFMLQFTYKFNKFNTVK